jgi:hypothetical protein
VQGRLEGGAVTVVVDGAPLDVPLTTGPAGQVPDGAAFGTPYGTGRSAWVPVTGERQLSTTARERT